MSNDDRVHLSREDLYELIWARPIQQVAAEYGLSDVGLAKICKRLEVPRPSRGYWRKLETGKKTPRARLPTPKERTPLQVELLRRPRERQEVEAPPVPVPEVVVTDELHRPHEVTKRLSALLGKDAYGDPPMLVIRQPYDTLIRVSPASKKRALCILDALFKALNARGHEVRLTEREVSYRRSAEIDLHVLVRDQSVRLGLTERSGQREHVPTADELAKQKRYGSFWTSHKFDRFVTGELALQVGRHQRFADGKKQRVEQKLGHAVLAVERLAAEYKVQEEKTRIEQQKAEVLRQQRETERRQQEHMLTLGKDLLQMAVRWSEARDLHAFLDAYEQRRPAGETTQGERQWFAWARAFATRLDPLGQMELVAKELTPPIGRPPI